MRKLTIVGGAAAVLLGASVVMAASPGPSAVPSASPAPSTVPSATPTPVPTTSPAAGSPSGSSTASTVWSAAVQPLALTGTATFTPATDGTATLTLAMHGLAPNPTMSVQVLVEPETKAEDPTVLFQAARSDVDRVGSGTVRVTLSQMQWSAIKSARSRTAVTILVGDGTNEAIATLAKA